MEKAMHIKSKSPSQDIHLVSEKNKIQIWAGFLFTTGKPSKNALCWYTKMYCSLLMFTYSEILSNELPITFCIKYTFF